MKISDWLVGWWVTPHLPAIFYSPGQHPARSGVRYSPVNQWIIQIPVSSGSFGAMYAWFFWSTGKIIMLYTSVQYTGCDVNGVVLGHVARCGLLWYGSCATCDIVAANIGSIHRWSRSWSVCIICDECRRHATDSLCNTVGITACCVLYSWIPTYQVVGRIHKHKHG